jgi:hypothetical protein
MEQLPSANMVRDMRNAGIGCRVTERAVHIRIVGRCEALE